MSGNADGARKAALTNKKKYGEDFYGKIGAKSWNNPERSRMTGFAKLPKDEHIELSRRGGKKTKDDYKTKEEFETVESLKEIFHPEDDEEDQISDSPSLSE